MAERPPLDPAHLDALRRTSGLSVHTEGHLLHHGQRFEHERLEALFLSGLDLHPDSGEAIVRVGQQWCYVACDATPFVIVAARLGSSGLQVRLNSGESVELTPASVHPWLQGEHRLWLPLPASEHHALRWARCGRRAWQRLAEHLLPDGDADWVLQGPGWQVALLRSLDDPLGASA